jgi:hypothetical protein
MAGRGWLLGEGIVSAVAESDWRGVGTQGVATRVTMLDQLDPLVEWATGEATVRQDDPTDISTASWKDRLELRERPASRLMVTIDGPDGVDLDLYVLRDLNGDGAVTANEVVGASTSPTADERVEVAGRPLPPGTYHVWAHGYDVPNGSTRIEFAEASQPAALWPDSIPADLRPSSTHPTDLSELVRGLAVRLPAPEGTATRAGPEPAHPFGKRQRVANGKAEARAALLIAHGMLRLFYPYFEVVGDGIDARLAEALATLEQTGPLDRLAFIRLLRRFGEVLKDGHQFVSNYGSNPFIGYLPVMVEAIDGLPVVRRSKVDEVKAGDTILSVDGRSSRDWYAEELARTSAATDGYRFDIASRWFIRLTGPVTLELRDPDGATRTATVNPQPAASLTPETYLVSLRPSGPLDDLGAPELYYLNADGEVTVGIEAFRAALADAGARQSRGLVVDMRGYPSNYDHYELAMRLQREPIRSARFGLGVYTGPDKLDHVVEQYDLEPLSDPAFDGPIVLLTGPHAVSAAENFMIMLVQPRRVRAVVGQQSAGTNGNITAIQLPGGFAFSYTGMNLTLPDGSRFHGLGIQPDVPVALTAKDLRDGIDRDLLTAIEVLRRP